MCLQMKVNLLTAKFIVHKICGEHFARHKVIISKKLEFKLETINWDLETCRKIRKYLLAVSLFYQSNQKSTRNSLNSIFLKSANIL